MVRTFACAVALVFAVGTMLQAQQNENAQSGQSGQSGVSGQSGQSGMTGMQVKGTIKKVDTANNMITVALKDGTEKEFMVSNRTRIVQGSGMHGGMGDQSASGERAGQSGQSGEQAGQTGGQSGERMGQSGNRNGQFGGQGSRMSGSMGRLSELREGEEVTLLLDRQGGTTVREIWLGGNKGQTGGGDRP